jgi:preprotein translocase subunit SecF
MSKMSRLGQALYDGTVSVDFVGKRRLWYAISVVVIAVAFLGLFWKGLNLGIEFEGGVEYRVTVPADRLSDDLAAQIREAVAATADEEGIDAAASPIANTSGDTTIRVQTEPLTNDEATVISQAIQDAADVGQDEISQDAIGATWGAQVADRALLGLGVFLVLVTLFIWAYFREWKMSVAAIVALAHDLLITIGVYALSGFEVTPATVTGVLTILGFSLYDTVVVFDKVRENTKNLRESKTTYARAANLAVNQTLVRSINTSIVALIPVGAILYVGAVQLGASTMKDLALALFVGMAAGAYSSIFIATPLLVQLKSRESVVMDAEKRDKVRKRHEADRYASVPAFTEDMPIAASSDDDYDEDAPVSGAAAPSREPRAPEASNRGRIAPAPRGPVKQSNAAGRVQPTRQPKSKRDKK